MTHIWPIGGGKGGSGKSFLVGNLGVWLAEQGKRTLMVDVDLGAANLHTIIGIPYPKKSISDFINKKVKTLEETVIETQTANLFLISGAKNSLDVANLPYAQKLKVLRAIKKLSYDFILLDIGAGTSFNIIDFFMISDLGVFVTTPEPTSIENIYRLIRAVYFRKVRKMIPQRDFKKLVETALTRYEDSSIDYLSALVLLMKEQYPQKGKALERSVQNMNFHLVLNQLRKKDNPRLGMLMCKIVNKYLGIKVEFLGNISYDDRVHDAVCEKDSFIYRYPYTQASLDIRNFCNNILSISNLKSNVRNDALTEQRL
ncbi:MAG: AAA family ATPase [Syntrophales bacterium]|nr:AAA family ATPase [Syntrophales bacterium]